MHKVFLHYWEDIEEPTILAKGPQRTLVVRDLDREEPLKKEHNIQPYLNISGGSSLKNIMMNREDWLRE